MAEMIPADQGRIVAHNIGAPGMGADFQIVMPIRTRWRIMAVYAWMTTAADVVDRRASLTIGLGANIYVIIPLRDVFTASNNYTCCWFSGADQPPITGDLIHVGNLPEKLLVNNQMVIASVTDNIQLGDEWDHIWALVEEWIEPLA